MDKKNKEPISYIMGGLIQERRKDLNLTQEYVGREIGKSDETISRYERAGIININKLAQICEVLNLRIDIVDITSGEVYDYEKNVGDNKCDDTNINDQPKELFNMCDKYIRPIVISVASTIILVFQIICILMNFPTHLLSALDFVMIVLFIEALIFTLKAGIYYLKQERINEVSKELT